MIGLARAGLVAGGVTTRGKREPVVTVATVAGGATVVSTLAAEVKVKLGIALMGAGETLQETGATPTGDTPAGVTWTFSTAEMAGQIATVGLDSAGEDGTVAWNLF